MLTNLLGAHDPILTLTIINHLTTKLLSALVMLHEMKGVSERFMPPKQGGEGAYVVPSKVIVKTESAQPRVTVKTETKTIHPEVKVTTELKDNVASGSGPHEKQKETADDSDSDVGETIAEALQRKKRERELNENLKVVKEEEERERRSKISVPIGPPPTTSQPTTSLPPTPLVTTIPISTSPLPPPIISQSTITTIPDPTVEVNVSDTGATTTTKTPVITKPLSPANSTDSGATLGGENDEYDSRYFGPYRLPSDEDNDAPVNSQHLQSIHEKLDHLLEDSKAYSGVVLKAFMETAIEQ
ncbi:uncharacterized protein LOC111887864 [Lactuca sativa]|uniref:uncharacterized protein LOC111887864 n=1 Tax=Lactuca sativa TaxID=4236 RepID=UPI000CD83DA0|nr:uncharacterized protein LOC111887864 [Lactuca sativa]